MKFGFLRKRDQMSRKGRDGWNIKIQCFESAPFMSLFAGPRFIHSSPRWAIAQGCASQGPGTRALGIRGQPRHPQPRGRGREGLGGLVYVESRLL